MSALFLALFNSILLYLYAGRIKRKGGFSKNLTVSYLVASPFLFGGLAAGNPSKTLFLVFIAFFVNISREVVKDIEDYKGDVDHLESLPVVYGFRISGHIAVIFLAASFFLSPVPYFLRMVNIFYIPFIIGADVMLAYCAVVLVRSPGESAGQVQRLIKAAMILALVGFLVGSQ
jgi:geranylgeranylglycerol-phosphate geranylgeranyltransferase